jgi:hypothetical protein
VQPHAPCSEEHEQLVLCIATAYVIIREMDKNKAFLLVIGLLALAATVLGFVNYGRGNFSGVSWPFVWIGIFIWGDGIVLGTFLLLGCVYLWFKNNSIATGMFFSAYALLRSLFEVQYNLNAQFSTLSRPWEAYVPSLALALHLDKSELYVLPQIMFTAISTLALLSLCYFAKKYIKS